MGKKRKHKSKSLSTRLLLGILFFLLFVLIGGGVWYFLFYQSAMNEYYEERLDSRVSGENTAIASSDILPLDTLQESISITPDSIVSQQPESLNADTTKTEVPETPVTTTTPETAPPPTTSRPVTTPASPQTTTTTTTSATNNVLARVTMEPGQRLTLIAEKYYGLKVFWVYIYEYNKEKIGPNPDRIPTGMEILVPAREIYDINANSAASVERATALQRRIMSGY
jgi:cytoskeletal protein RodZ